MMRTQRMRMVPSNKHYHDIFKCLNDEILRGGTRKNSTKETIKEGDDGYTSYISTEAEGYYDLDEERKRKERKGKKELAPTHPPHDYDQDTTYYASEEYGYDGYD